MQQVAQRIKERTNGAIEIQCYDSSQLAVYKDNIEQVVNGADWIACENEYARGDRAAVKAGALDYLNTIAVTLVKG